MIYWKPTIFSAVKDFSPQMKIFHTSFSETRSQDSSLASSSVVNQTQTKFVSLRL